MGRARGVLQRRCQTALRGVPMLAPDPLYPAVLALLQALGVAPRATAVAALAELVRALLRAQSVRPADLMRSVASRSGVPARQRYKRVARALGRPWLSPAWLTPRLVRAALAQAQPEAGAVLLALDGLRCGPWEILVLGVRWHGRGLPVGWAVLRYPWPKGSFTPTTCALIRQVAAAWPVAAPQPHLVADRGFPSRELFLTLRHADWGWTVRLRAQSPVSVSAPPRTAGQLVEPLARGQWHATPGAYGRGPRALPGTLVAGRPLAVLPAWQTRAGSLQARAAQRDQRERHLRAKHPGRALDRSTTTAQWVILFTTCSDALTAQRAYSGRWAIEGTFRDLQGGWDGRHGWGLEAVASHAASAEHVAALVGLLALGYLVQATLGHAAASPAAPLAVVQARRGWCTTSRLSLWARGHFLLQDRSGALDAWVAATLQATAARLAPALPPLARAA